jgi:hypothetical protein
MNPFDRLIRDALWQWQSWRMRRALRRAVPELKNLRDRRDRLRRQHRRVSAVEREMCRVMNATLAGPKRRSPSDAERIEQTGMV